MLMPLRYGVSTGLLPFILRYVATCCMCCGCVACIPCSEWVIFQLRYALGLPSRFVSYFW